MWGLSRLMGRKRDITVSRYISVLWTTFANFRQPCNFRDFRCTVFRQPIHTSPTQAPCQPRTATPRPNQYVCIGPRPCPYNRLKSGITGMFLSRASSSREFYRPKWSMYRTLYANTRRLSVILASKYSFTALAGANKKAPALSCRLRQN